MPDREGAEAAGLTREDHLHIARLERALVAARDAFDADDSSANLKAEGAACDAHNCFKGDLECCYQLWCYRSTADTGRAYCSVHDDNPAALSDADSILSDIEGG